MDEDQRTCALMSKIERNPRTPTLNRPLLKKAVSVFLSKNVRAMSRNEEDELQAYLFFVQQNDTNPVEEGTWINVDDRQFAETLPVYGEN